MKKVLVCALVIVCIFALVSCGSDKAIRDAVGGKKFIYEKEGAGGEFSIRIDAGGTYTYYEGETSSYIGMGHWSVDGDILVLADDSGYAFVNRFKVVDGDLVFVSDKSTNFLHVKVADGERFAVKSEG